MNDGHQGQLRAFFAKKRKQSLRQTLVDHARDDGVSQRLRKVASELSDHCACLPGEGSQSCREALEYLTVKLSHGRDELDELETLEANLRGCGTQQDVIVTLRVLDRVEHHRPGQTVSEAPSPSSPHLPASEAPASRVGDIRGLPAAERAQLCRDLFARFDADQNGFLDVAEFRECMKALGIALTGREVALIFEAFACPLLRIPQDVFEQIVECEDMHARSAMSKFVRHHDDAPSFMM